VEGKPEQAARIQVGRRRIGLLGEADRLKIFDSLLHRPERVRAAEQKLILGAKFDRIDRGDAN
jgi:hypothetical protein